MSGKEKERKEERREREDHSLGGGSMMDNISKMIPAPLSSSSSKHGTAADHGSGEEGDW